MILYRIAKCKYANDLSGEGAAKYSGRWNSKGTRLVYTSTSISLANLEFLVNTDGLPLRSEICIMHIEVPNHSIKVCTLENLPSNWTTNLMNTQKLGNDFITEQKHLLYQVPSAVINEENNILINPLHPLAYQIELKFKNPFTFDPRLLKK